MTRDQLLAALLVERYGPLTALELEQYAHPTHEYRQHHQPLLLTTEVIAQRLRTLAASRADGPRHLRRVS